MNGGAVAVIDIGKTNAKLALIEPGTGAELAVRTTGNASRADGPYPHYDVARLFAFLLDALADARASHGIAAISITAHGAAAALLSGAEEGDGLALPVLDYEHDGPDAYRADYDAVRPPFSETFSPRLPGGLNVGAQLFFQDRRFPAAFGAARAFVTYPQYWAWRLTGIAATEVTSLGSHTDLWNPRARAFSSLVADQGWGRLMTPIRSAFEPLAALRPDLAARLGLGSGVPVHCGIHDSNASLLPHLLTREPPFTVVSTGTWVIVFAVGGSLDALDERRDGLANVNAYGDPVPSARFMGGREFDLLTGGRPSEPSQAEIDRVLGEGVMALPGFVPGVGPFPDSAGRWTVDPAGLDPGERTAAASLYAALVTVESCRVAGAGGPVVVAGPFAGNRLYCAALAALLDRPVMLSSGRTGTNAGAALLAANQGFPSVTTGEPTPPLRRPLFARYASLWRDRAAH